MECMMHMRGLFNIASGFRWILGGLRNRAISVIKFQNYLCFHSLHLETWSSLGNVRSVYDFWLAYESF